MPVALQYAVQAYLVLSERSYASKQRIKYGAAQCSAKLDAHLVQETLPLLAFQQQSNNRQMLWHSEMIVHIAVLSIGASAVCFHMLYRLRNSFPVGASSFVDGQV